jgi:hypothetical protein
MSAMSGGFNCSWPTPALGQKRTFDVPMDMSALLRERTCAVQLAMSAKGQERTLRCERANSGRLKLVAASLPQTDVLDRGRQRFGLVLLAVGRDLCGIALKAVVVQDVAIGSRIVITTHPKADKIPLLWTVSEPTATSDLIHIHADLSYTWLRSGRQQSRCY